MIAKTKPIALSNGLKYRTDFSSNLIGWITLNHHLLIRSSSCINITTFNHQRDWNLTTAEPINLNAAIFLDEMNGFSYRNDGREQTIHQPHPPFQSLPAKMNVYANLRSELRFIIASRMHLPDDRVSAIYLQRIQNMHVTEYI